MKYKIYNVANNNKYSIRSIARYLKENYNLNYNYKEKQVPKTQYLFNCKINDECKIRYRNFYKELNQIIVSK